MCSDECSGKFLTLIVFVFLSEENFKKSTYKLRTNGDSTQLEIDLHAFYLFKHTCFKREKAKNHKKVCKL